MAAVTLSGVHKSFGSTPVVHGVDIEIDFKASGDKDYRKLLVGDKAPTGSDMFAKRNDEKKVFLIPAFQDSSFNKDTFSLREKQLLKFERDKVDRVELAAAGKNLAIAKEGTEWKLTTPVQARADFGAAGEYCR